MRTTDFPAKLEQWREIDLELKRLKKLEMQMRIELCQEAINGCKDSALIGKNNKKIDLSDYEYSFDSNTTLKMDFNSFEDFVEEDKLNNDEIACVDYKPQLSKAKLKNVSEDSLIWDLITEHPAAPTIKYKEK